MPRGRCSFVSRFGIQTRRTGLALLGVHCCLGAFSDRIDHHYACVFTRMVDSTIPTAGAGQFKRALVLQILPQMMTAFGVRGEGRRLLDELRGAAGELTEIVFRVRRQFDAKGLSGRFARQLVPIQLNP
jgi:hypothetical protein